VITVQFTQRNDILDAMIAAGAPFDPAAPLGFLPYMSPIPQDTRLDRTAVLALAATFTGSAAKTPAVWGAKYKDGFDNVYRDAQLCEWICTVAPAEQQTIYGVIWDNGTDVCIDPFATPVVIKDPGDIVRYIPTLSYGQ